VKKAALAVMGGLYCQFGPALEPFVKSKSPPAGTMSSIEKVFADATHDPSAQSRERKMRCITLSAVSNAPSAGTRQKSALAVPETDLVSSLKSDCISRMTSTDGKNSWKLRKEAMEEVTQEAEKCAGLLSTEGKAYLTLKELMVALRSRMNDSQSNLKPLAAATMTSVLSRVDESSQAKLGKVVFPSLVNAAMTDMKKTMRDASLAALQAGMRQSDQDGGCVNMLAFDVLVLSLQAELSDAAIKSVGLPDLLSLMVKLLEPTCSQSDERLPSHVQLAKVIVSCLLSSKCKS
jgi:cytoskeleton-associated protein 5